MTVVTHQVSTPRSTVVWAMGVLVFCLAMQVLGAPVTLWDLPANPGTLSGSIYEGVSVPSTGAIARTWAVTYVPLHEDEFMQGAVLSVSLFHPPLLASFL